MIMMAKNRACGIGPRQKKHFSYDESVDESAKTIDDEPTGIEDEQPADENEPVQGVDGTDVVEPPAFEE